MWRIFVTILQICLINFVYCTCPNGKIEHGVNTAGHKLIIDKHNSLRALVLNGTLSGQPKAISMEKVKWDINIAKEAQKIADTCVYGHVVVKDARWSVGQNIYLFESTDKHSGSDWDTAIQTWFDEYKIYKYPTLTHETGHYTQIVWATTKYVGCGYAFYESPEDLPFKKYYVCNYGPAGNIIGIAPYKTKK